MRINKFFSTTLIFLVIAIFTTAGCAQDQKTENKPANPTTTAKTATAQSTIEATSPVKTGKLSGYKILIDAGHGCTKTYTEPIAPNSTETRVESPSTGTFGVAIKKPEGQLTLEIALRLEKRLKKLGATVYMIRRTKGTAMSLTERAEYGNKRNVDLAFRIHADGIEDSSVNGASVLYPSTIYVDREVCKKSKTASEYIIDAYTKETGFYNRGTIERSDLTGFNFTKVPCILIELGFMTNPDEDTKMSQKDFQKKMTGGITKGIVKYFENIK